MQTPQQSPSAKRRASATSPASISPSSPPPHSPPSSSSSSSAADFSPFHSRAGSSSPFLFPPCAPPLRPPSSAPLSLPALQALASDPAITSAQCSAGTLVDRFHDGHHRRYILYSCIVCGKQSGDKSKHKKHERACKRRLIRQKVEAEKEEERRTRQASVAEKRRLQDHRSRTALLQLRSHGKQERGAALMVPPRPAFQQQRKAGRAGDVGEAPQSRGLSKAEYHQLLARELKAVYHSADATPDGCLLSRDSVLTRIDLTDIFHAPDLWSHFSPHDIRSLCELLPETDRTAIQRAQQQQPPDDAEDSAAPLATSSFLSRSSDVHSAALALPTLVATVSDPVFGRSLGEYQQLLRTGSLDPALKGLRLMAEGKRRREQRQQSEWKKQHFEAYWGEALSEIHIHVQKPQPSAAADSDEADHSQPSARSGKREEQPRRAQMSRSTSPEKGRRPAARRVTQVRGATIRAARPTPPSDDDSDATQSDGDTRSGSDASDHETGGVFSDEDGAQVDSSSQVSSDSPRHSVPSSSRQPRPLHNTFRRRRAMSWSSAEEEGDEEQGDEDELDGQHGAGSTSSPPSSSSSPAPPGPAPRLASLLPLPQPVQLLPVPLPTSYPIIQRFHFRSPRFRMAKRATFVMRAPGERDAADASPSRHASSTAKSHKKRKLHGGEAAAFASMPGSPSQPPLFSHLPPSVARECTELRSRVWSEEAKAAALRVIAATSSSRLKRLEQDKLDAALQAEARLLRLMEETGDRRARQQQRQGEATDGLQRPRSRRSQGDSAGRGEAGGQRKAAWIRGGSPDARSARLDGGDDEQSEAEQSTAEEEGEASVQEQRLATTRQSEEAAPSSLSSPSSAVAAPSLRSSAAVSVSAAERWQSKLPLSSKEAQRADLRRHVFSPADSAGQNAFSTFVVHTARGPAAHDAVTRTAHTAEQW